MALVTKVKIRVLSRSEGRCSWIDEREGAVGKEWEWGRSTPAGICQTAYQTLWPICRAFEMGGKYPTAKNPDVQLVRCPSATPGAASVVFEVIREWVDA
jgi:uncharacterized repeat protein (TIGR04076 family)